MDAQTAGPDSKLTSGERRIAWLVWFTYGAFYFCRTNLSAAVPGLEAAPSAGGLGLNEREIGSILAALKIAYAIGQLINGQLAERVPPRVLLATGMFGSAALNIAFGFSTSLYFLIFLWASNGYCQSLGWTPCIRVIANWTPVHKRGKVIGFIGTGYQLAGSLTFVTAGLAAEYLGWRGALFIPAGILIAAGITTLLLLEEAPSENSQDAGTIAKPGADGTPVMHDLATTLRLTLTNPALWVLGISLGLLDACRYGFIDWGLKHLTDVQGASVGGAALRYMILPAGGAVGMLTAGWATDRYFGSRRAPVACMLLASLGGACLAYHRVAEASVTATILLLFLIGFCTFGPQILLVGSAPADLARGGAAAAAAGFVNFMGYVGAALGDYFTGRSLQQSGWQDTIYLWAGWAFTAAVAAGMLWNVGAASRPREHSESSS
jgi:sugar phosphate permease